MTPLLRNLFLILSLGAAAARADVTLYPTQDRDVYQGTGMPTSTPESLGVSSSAAFGGGHSQKSLIQFNVTTATAGMTADEVGTATLRLYTLRPEVYPRGYDIGGTVQVFLQSTAWVETSLFWASFVPSAQVASFTMTADRNLGDGSSTWTYPIGTWYEVDVTSAVKLWLGGSVPNHGLILSPDESGSPFLSATFADSITGFKPQLVIKRKAAELKVTHFAYDGTNVDLEWSATAGKTYRVMESTDLQTWTPRETVSAATAIGAARFAGTSAPKGRAFYQVVEVVP